MATVNKLASKAAKLDFSKLPGVAPLAQEGAGASAAGSAAGPGTPSTVAPKTAPGALMAFANDARSSLMRENEDLRQRAAQAESLRTELASAHTQLAQWDGAKPARLLDPALIIRSRYANRHEVNFTGAEYEQLKAEIGNAGGNVQPIKVRPLAVVPEGDKAPQFEVVFGHRRLQACRELGLKVLAVVDALSDTELFVEMDRENRTRKDLSAWEQGAMYQRALDEGLFPSNRKLAEAVGVDLGNLGRALALARLPQEVVQAFASPLDLQFRWAKALSDAAAADRAGLVARAQALAQRQGELAPKAVFEQLIAPLAPAAGGGLYGTTPAPESLVAESVAPNPMAVSPAPVAPIAIARQGKPVAWLSWGERGAVNLAMAPGALAPERLAALARHIEAFLAQ